MDHVKPVFNTNPPGWILTIPGESDLEYEEFIIRLQGVIVQKELPPITERYGQQGTNKLLWCIDDSTGQRREFKRSSDKASSWQDLDTQFSRLHWKHSTIEPTSYPGRFPGDYGYIHTSEVPRAPYYRYWNTVLHIPKGRSSGTIRTVWRFGRSQRNSRRPLSTTTTSTALTT